MKDLNEGVCARNHQGQFSVHHKIYRRHEMRLNVLENHFLQPQQARLVAAVHMIVSFQHRNH
jgi:hypothetical protein